MINIENISVKEKYSVSVWFSKDYKKEIFLFGNESQKRIFFSNKNAEIYETENKKRNFGELIADGLAFAKSDDIRVVRSNVDALADILKRGRGLDKVEPHKIELFRIYNSTENPMERYVILKLWHELMLRHDEVNSLKNTMQKGKWKQIGTEYAEFADRMLMPFERGFTGAADIQGLSGSMCMETVTDKVTECVYTFDEDILPLYILYLSEFAKRNKTIQVCDVCGRQFVASRKDERACGTACRKDRQSGYNKTHKEKVGNDELDKLFQQNRYGYDNFIKKLRAHGIDEVPAEYQALKNEYLGEGKDKRAAYRQGKLADEELRKWINADFQRRQKWEFAHEEIFE